MGRQRKTAKGPGQKFASLQSRRSLSLNEYTLRQPLIVETAAGSAEGLREVTRSPIRRHRPRFAWLRGKESHQGTIAELVGDAASHGANR